MDPDEDQDQNQDRDPDQDQDQDQVFRVNDLWKYHIHPQRRQLDSQVASAAKLGLFKFRGFLMRPPGPIIPPPPLPRPPTSSTLIALDGRNCA